MFTVTDEQLERLEAKAEVHRRAHDETILAQLNLRAAEYETHEANRGLDETLLSEENLPTIPLFGKRRKDSH